MKELKLNKLYKEYLQLFDRYNELYDIYELCDERFDRDILEPLVPELEMVLEQIFELEGKLLKFKDFKLPDNRTTKHLRLVGEQ